jgi:hypothetical protein
MHDTRRKVDTHGTWMSQGPRERKSTIHDGKQAFERKNEKRVECACNYILLKQYNKNQNNTFCFSSNTPAGACEPVVVAFVTRFVELSRCWCLADPVEGAIDNDWYTQEDDG